MHNEDVDARDRRGHDEAVDVWTHQTIDALCFREDQPEDIAMGKCAQCGNNYDQSFEVTMGGRTLTFDSFECAIAALAPVCPHCGCRIIGHGVQHGDTIYCCVHCAKHEGVKGLVDRD